jgi:hypothetical protein
MEGNIRDVRASLEVVWYGIFSCARICGNLSLEETEIMLMVGCEHDDSELLS